MNRLRRSFAVYAIQQRDGRRQLVSVGEGIWKGRAIIVILDHPVEGLEFYLEERDGEA